MVVATEGPILWTSTSKLKKRQRFEDAERIFQEDTEIGTKMDKSKTKPKSKQKMFDDYYQKHGKVVPKDPRTKKDHPMNRFCLVCNKERRHR